jgi:hypothetical protein
MAFRDKQWYIDAIERQQNVVAQNREQLTRLIDSCDHSMAAMRCDNLKASLIQLNELENAMADKGF